MSEYLTSSKICLLVITAIYCQGHVPAERAISVLSFIASRLQPGSHVDVQSQKSSLNLEDIANQTKALLEAHTSVRSGGNLWREFVLTLQRIDNLDSLFDFFTSLEQLFTARYAADGGLQVILTKTSLLGAFVRRCCLEFEKLSFQNAIALWQHFEGIKKSIGGDISLAEELKESTGALDGVEAADAASGGRISRILSSNQAHDSTRKSYDLERLLDFQIHQMQKYGCRLPNEMVVHIQELGRPSSEVPGLSFYTSFLDSWYAGNYPTSFEYLHRYYDYTMHNKDRSQYQYALLNMAIFQADFGCYDEAFAAMRETIATARENKDNACLIFSLSWLYHFRSIFGADKAHGSNEVSMGSDSQSLAFLKSRALENKMWVVASSTMLCQARLVSSLGRRPRQALDLVSDAFHMNVKHNLEGSMGPQLLEQASILARLGVTNLSQVHCKLVIDCYAGDVLAQDTLRARCRDAYAATLASDYKTAEKLLSAVGPEVHRNLQLHQFVTTLNGILNLQRELHHNDLIKAELLINSLKNTPCLDPELRFQIALLRVDYLTRLGDFDEAYDLIDSLSSRSRSYKVEDPGAVSGITARDIYQQILLLIAKARLYAKFQTPQKGLSLALRATVAAMTAKIFPALFEAVGVMAGVLVAIGELEEAINLLDSVVWQATEVQNTRLMAFLQSTYANASMKIAGDCRHDKVRFQDQLRRTRTWVQRAQQSYERLEDTLGLKETTVKAQLVSKLLDDEAGVA